MAVLTPLEDREMTLVEHLEELRSRLIVCLCAIAVGTGIIWLWAGDFLGWLARPVGGLIFVAPTEAFFTRMRVAMFGGLLLTLPILLHQIWAFTARALGKRVRGAVAKALPASYALFLVGVWTAVAWVVPAAMTFLVAYGGDNVRPMLTVGAYVEFVTALAIAFGCVFQIPLILLLLNRAGLVSRATLAGKRRYAWFGAFIAAGVLTPGPDVVSQLALGVPMVLFFEFSLWLMR